MIEFEERGVEEDDLIKVKAGIESGSIFGLQSVSGKVSQLAANQTFSNNPNYIGEDIARYNAVTKEDVMRVYKKYIKDQHAVIMSVVPKGQLSAIAASDNFVPLPEATAKIMQWRLMLLPLIRTKIPLIEVKFPLLGPIRPLMCHLCGKVVLTMASLF